MEYFRLRQDYRYKYPPRIENFSANFRRSDFNLARASKINDKNVVMANSTAELDFISVLDQQAYLVKEDVKKVFDLFEPSIKYKFFCILNNTLGDYAIYYAPILNEFSALSQESQMNLDRSVFQKIVLLSGSVPDKGIFKLSDVNSDVIIVRLDVAESLLRRHLKGFTLEPIYLI